MYSRGLFNCTIIRENIDNVKWHKVCRNAIDANVDASACSFVNVSLTTMFSTAFTIESGLLILAWIMRLAEEIFLKLSKTICWKELLNETCILDNGS